MREAVRLSWRLCEGPVDVVFNPRKSVLTMPFAKLVNEVSQAVKLVSERARAATKP
jgi:hypothetical protein